MEYMRKTGSMKMECALDWIKAFLDGRKMCLQCVYI